MSDERPEGLEIAIKALEALEFTPNDIWSGTCYWCRGYARHPAMDQDYYGKPGHKPSCLRQRALTALREQSTALARLREALKQSSARLYPDANYERYLDEITGSLVEGVQDQQESDGHQAQMNQQAVEAISALRRTRDELRSDLHRVAVAALSSPSASEQDPKDLDRPTGPAAR